MIAKLRNQFNVSVAEVGDNDVLKSSTLGIAVVSNDSSFGHSVISQVVNRIDSNPEVVLIDQRTESF